MTAEIIPFPMPNRTGKISTEQEMIDWAVRQLIGTNQLGHENWTQGQAAEFGKMLWAEFQTQGTVK